MFFCIWVVVPRGRYTSTGLSTRWRRLATALTTTWSTTIARQVCQIDNEFTARRSWPPAKPIVERRQMSPTFACSPPTLNYCPVSISSTHHSWLVSTCEPLQLCYLLTTVHETCYMAGYYVKKTAPPVSNLLLSNQTSRYRYRGIEASAFTRFALLISFSSSSWQ